MNVLPCLAQLPQMTRQGGFDRPDFSPRKSVVFPELYRPCRTVEIEYRFTAPSDDVNMRPTVLRFDGLRVAVYPNDHRPGISYSVSHILSD